ncbi:MAG: L-threonylcarbamoyladenylate synthase [Granulosicoccus sp.]
MQKAIDAVRTGGIIAYPTEGVYGLGCDPHNQVALQRIIDLKGRDSHKGFIIVASSQGQLAGFMAPVQDDWQTQFDQAWPGPVTFIVPAIEGISGLLSGYRDSMAVRVSNHPIVCGLCRLYGGALVSTSANRSGREALKSAEDVQIEFGGGIDVVVDGPLGGLTTSTTIIDVKTGARLR